MRGDCGQGGDGLALANCRPVGDVEIVVRIHRDGFGRRKPGGAAEAVGTARLQGRSADLHQPAGSGEAPDRGVDGVGQVEDGEAVRRLGDQP